MEAAFANPGMASAPAAGDSGPVCSVCDGADFRKIFRKGGRDFWRCRTCGYEVQHPLPSARELRTYYEESYVSGMYQLFTDADAMKRLTADQRLREIEPFVRPGRWLDVGCANGLFVAAARGRGRDARGIDLSATAVAAARRHGLPVECRTIEDFQPDVRFDTVTAFDVLEHVLDPAAFLRAVRQLLAPGATIAITVPNLSSLSRVLMRRRWYFYIPEEHLHYFTPSCLETLLVRTGFEIVRRARTYKPLTWNYSLSQLAAYNPLIHRALAPLSACIPPRLRERALPLYIGEMMVIARTSGSAPAARERRDGVGG
jgi:2-polyprenyl-3-methyl-5-hydroxy-6-metoxy-1,4-benzoquinol methylase